MGERQDYLHALALGVLDLVGDDGVARPFGFLLAVEEVRDLGEGEEKGQYMVCSLEEYGLAGDLLRCLYARNVAMTHSEICGLCFGCDEATMLASCTLSFLR